MSDIKPALSAEEWAELHERRVYQAHPWQPDHLDRLECRNYGKLRLLSVIDQCVDIEQSGGPEGELHNDRHALAAIALHGQPFGFQHWMVDWLRTASWDVVPAEIQNTMRHEYELDEYIARRIVALLPPREP